MIALTAAQRREKVDNFGITIAVRIHMAGSIFKTPKGVFPFGGEGLLTAKASS